MSAPTVEELVAKYPDVDPAEERRHVDGVAQRVLKLVVHLDPLGGPNVGRRLRRRMIWARSAVPDPEHPKRVIVTTREGGLVRVATLDLWGEADEYNLVRLLARGPVS